MSRRKHNVVYKIQRRVRRMTFPGWHDWEDYNCPRSLLYADKEEAKKLAQRKNQEDNNGGNFEYRVLPVEIVGAKI